MPAAGVSGRSESHRSNPLLSALALAVLSLALITGGGSRDYGWGDAITQVLALLLLATLAMAWWRGSLRTKSRWPLLIAASLALVPALHALPWPGTGDGLHADVAADLARVGNVSGSLAWGLSRAGTEQALWFLLPPVAMLLATPQLHAEWLRRLWAAVIAIAVFSALLAMLQLGLPRDSLLNPFPEFEPAFGGVFSNPGHHADLLCIAMLFAAVWSATAWREHERRRCLLWGAAGAFLLAVIPFCGSRAGVVIAVGAATAWILLSGIATHAWHARRKRQRVVFAVAALGLATAAFVAWRFMQVDMLHEHRWQLRAATAGLAQANLPWGIGFGTFVAAFEQEVVPIYVDGAYVNHAHNEYVQWWLEAGVLAIPALLLLLAGFAWSLRQILRLPWGGRRMHASALWVGMVVLLAHSWVDYPLRTQALSTLAGLMAGFLFALLHGAAVAHPKPVSRTHASLETGSL